MVNTGEYVCIEEEGVGYQPTPMVGGGGWEERSLNSRSYGDIVSPQLAQKFRLFVDEVTRMLGELELFGIPAKQSIIFQLSFSTVVSPMVSVLGLSSLVNILTS